MTDLNSRRGTSKPNEKLIDFRFRTKLTSYQGTILFEFKVFLPYHIYQKHQDDMKNVKSLGNG